MGLFGRILEAGNIGGTWLHIWWLKVIHSFWEKNEFCIRNDIKPVLNIESLLSKFFQIFAIRFLDQNHKSLFIISFYLSKLTNTKWNQFFEIWSKSDIFSKDYKKSLRSGYGVEVFLKNREDCSVDIFPLTLWILYLLQSEDELFFVDLKSKIYFMKLFWMKFYSSCIEFLNQVSFLFYPINYFLFWINSAIHDFCFLFQLPFHFQEVKRKSVFTNFKSNANDFIIILTCIFCYLFFPQKSKWMKLKRDEKLIEVTF
jgi:hypothetical protein